MLEEVQHYKILGQEVEQWVIVGVLLTIAFLFRKWGAKIVNRVLYRIVAKKGSASVEKSKRFNELVGRPMQFLGMMIAFYISFTLLTIPDTLELFDEKIRLSMYLGVIFKLLITLAITRILIKITEFVGELWIEKAEATESKLDDQLVPFLKDSIKVLIVIFAILIVLGMVFKVNVSALIGGLGIGGLAIALAAQESLANLLGSFTIFLDKPFTVGDTIDFNGIVGSVEKVGFRSTRIRTLDKSYVTVPNKSLVGAPLNNITESTHRRARFFIGVLYSTPPETLKNIISEIHDVLLRHENTNDEPLVRFFEYGESSLNVLVTYLVNTNDYNEYCKVREDINFKIYEIVLRNGSDFAFPTRTLHLNQESAAPVSTKL